MRGRAVLGSAPAHSRGAGTRVVGGIRARWRRARQRALADAWLAWGAVPHEQSRLLSPRADELTSAKSRRALARGCRRYVAEIRDPPCSSYAVNRVALREHVGSLARLGARLSDLSKPASAHSILLAREVVDGNGPLFNRALAEELGRPLNARYGHSTKTRPRARPDAIHRKCWRAACAAASAFIARSIGIPVVSRE
jgi:hypothetical protein